jgi:hypothetical protein
MNKLDRKFIMTKALYVLLWVFTVYWSLYIILSTINSLIDEGWHPIGLLYEGCIWDYLMFATSLLLALSFKKEV